MKMSVITKRTNLTFEGSLKRFFREESKSKGYKSEKVKKFINYYKPFYQFDNRYLDYIENGEFLESHMSGVLWKSIGLEVYRRLILDEDKDWVKYMVEEYFSSRLTTEYLESQMMMRGV